MRNLETFLYPTQSELFKLICRMYGSEAVSRNGKYILVRGKAPVMLLAHLDTVHKTPVKCICKSQDGNILMSPQGIGGDDRCGVYALISAHENSKVKPWLLFTCDEEIGGKGADSFAEDFSLKRLPKALRSVKMLIEVDRKGKNDAVYYDCWNKEFEDYITGKGFETDYGSFSDISTIAPAMGVAAVNLSSGYYNAHTTHEYINLAELESTIEKVVEIVAESCAADFPTFEYVEAPRFRSFRDRLDAYSWDFGWGEEQDWFAPEDLPEEYAAAYEALLDYYSSVELEELREAYGDRVILDLYESEYGDYEQEEFPDFDYKSCG